VSVEVKIEIRFDRATPRLKRALAACQPKRMATVLAPVLAEHWRDHLAGLPRNKNGYPSTGFWEEAARSVTGLALDDGVMLRCGKVGVRQRLHGGPIVASGASNLTIPICAEAYGTTVADWGRDRLTLVILADGRKFLAIVGGLEGGTSRRASGNARRAHKYAQSGGDVPKVIIFKGGGSGTGSRAERHMDIKFLFKLQPSTLPQEPNPDVVPPDMGKLAKETLLVEVLG
jgi:hypothetical protein